MPDLADGARRSRQLRGANRLNRIHHDDREAIAGQLIQDRFEGRLGHHLDPGPATSQTVGPHPQLPGRLLGADIENLLCCAGETVRQLQEQGRLADSGFTSQQHGASFDQSPTQHAVESRGPGGRSVHL